ALVEGIRQDADRRALIVAISGAARGAEMTAAFVQAVQCIIGDVLLPTLYRVPVIGVRDGKRQLRAALMSLYVSALVMADKNEGAVKKVAECRIAEFEEVIDALGTPGASEQVVTALVDDLLRVLGRKDTAAQLKEGIRVLSEALDLYEATGEESDRAIF